MTSLPDAISQPLPMIEGGQDFRSSVPPLRCCAPAPTLAECERAAG